MRANNAAPGCARRDSHGVRRLLLVGALSLLAGTLASLAAQDDRGAGGAPPRLGLGAESARKAPARGGAGATNAQASDARTTCDGVHCLHLHPPAAGWLAGGYYPWYWLPATRSTRLRPPSNVHTPRLGLQHTYLDAQPMGIVIPTDTEPLETGTSLGPFEGIVASARREALEEGRPWPPALAGEEAAPASAPGDAAPGAGEAPAAAPAPEDVLPAKTGAADAVGADVDAAIALLKEGKTREAGRLLARGFAATDDPRYPLLLCEVFVLLGKPKHATLFLEKALASPLAAAALPDAIAGHMPNGTILAERTQEIISGGDEKLLGAYLLLHSPRPQEGLDLCLEVLKEQPKNEGARKLYGHYLAKAFGE